MSYAELHCLSNFSFLRGASHADELVARASALGYAALAITDECSLAGAVRMHRAAKASGLKLIVGSEFTLEDGLKLVVLAPDLAAYSQLCRLITRGRRNAAKGAYRLVREDLAEGLPGCLVLWLPPRPKPRLEDAHWVASTFPERAWIAAELHREAGDAARRRALAALARDSRLPIVASGDVHMHDRERQVLQDVVTAIRHGCTVAQAGTKLFGNGERHLRTLDELAELYPATWREETLRIAARCTFSMDELRYEYPHELVPPSLTPIQHLRALTEQGLRERWPQGPEPRIRDQIEKELELIAEKRYEHFFLTVHDIVQWARGQGILCQGRGSAANSAVCYALGVTAVNPAESNMLFERFLSRERDEPPDIDVDFEHQRREEVIQHVYDKYGRDRCALAATVIAYRVKSAIRDVGKALGFSLEEVARLADAHAWWDGVAGLPLRLAELGFDSRSLRVRQLMYCVPRLAGAPRHLSQHVGGFVISERPMHELAPIENAAMPGRTVLQWDKSDLETLGLLKVDCLALGMLSALRRTFEIVNAWNARHRPRQPVLDLASVPRDDAPTYRMIQQARTMGVFQIESRAQMTMLPRLRPENFYDLVIEVAIVRPGPIQGKMVHPYLRNRELRRAGRDIRYPDERLRPVLERTLGVPIFQEQVMQIAMVAARFTPGEADQLRRKMAAWKDEPNGLDGFRPRLLAGMKANGYDPAFSERIFEQLRGFGEYGFPESHSASFALLVYASAWLRCHHLAAFTAGLLNSQPMGFYPPSMLIREAQRSGVEVRPVDVTVSGWECALEAGAEGNAALRLGLRLVKGLSETAAQALVAARAAAPFQDVQDLVDRARLDGRARRRLADSGALEALAGHRHRARWAALGAERLPPLLDGVAAREGAAALRPPREGEDIGYDYGALGFTLGRHPVALLRPRLARHRVLRAADLESLPNGAPVKVGGMVMFRQRPGTAQGVVFVSLEDESGVVNLILWPSVVEAQRGPMLQSRLLVAAGELQRESGVTHVVAHRLHDCSAWLGSIQSQSRDFH